MIEYRYLRPEDAPLAANIHIAGQQGTTLTLLGQSFLEEFYRAVCCSVWAEGVGAYDDGKLAGFVAVAVSSDKFFAEFKRKHLWRVSIPAAWAVIKHPKIIKYVVQGWNYSDQTLSPERECDGLFIGVKREYLRLGLAPTMVKTMFAWANSIGIETVTFMIEKRNRPMRWMVGFLNDLYVAHEFEAYGRTMLFYKAPIAANLEGAEMPKGTPCTPAYNYSNHQGGN